MRYEKWDVVQQLQIVAGLRSVAGRTACVSWRHAAAAAAFRVRSCDFVGTGKELEPRKTLNNTKTARNPRKPAHVDFGFCISDFGLSFAEARTQ